MFLIDKGNKFAIACPIVLVQMFGSCIASLMPLRIFCSFGSAECQSASIGGFGLPKLDLCSRGRCFVSTFGVAHLYEWDKVLLVSVFRHRDWFFLDQCAEFAASERADRETRMVRSLMTGWSGICSSSP